ncbi:MAG: hypothetical protein QOI76_1429 [Frankiales bacterium]|jgi:hypothetical protein|nr:hypothetical protein [Frankiales bacterium]
MSTETATASRRNKFITLITRTLTAALVTTSVALLAPATAASASVSYSAGTVSAGAACNRYTHHMTIQGSIVLSNRFPKGAYVATRYAYYTVNSSTLQATSAVATTGWVYSNVAASTIVQGDLTISNISASLPAMGFNTWGQFRVMAQVGVWNGRAYEYSNWDTATGYDNYGQYGIYSYYGVCLASAT